MKIVVASSSYSRGVRRPPHLNHFRLSIIMFGEASSKARGPAVRGPRNLLPPAPHRTPRLHAGLAKFGLKQLQLLQAQVRARTAQADWHRDVRQRAARTVTQADHTRHATGPLAPNAGLTTPD